MKIDGASLGLIFGVAAPRAPENPLVKIRVKLPGPTFAKFRMKIPVAPASVIRPVEIEGLEVGMVKNPEALTVIPVIFSLKNVLVRTPNRMSRKKNYRGTVPRSLYVVVKF